MMYDVIENLLFSQILVKCSLSDTIILLNTEVFPVEGFYISKKVHCVYANVHVHVVMM